MMTRKDRWLQAASAVMLTVALGWLLVPRSLGSELARQLNRADPPDVRTARWSVALLFQMRDCRERTGRFRVWNELVGDSVVTVSGFLLGPDLPPDPAPFLVELGLDFPIHTIALSGSVQSSLRSAGFGATPLLVVRDPEGRIRALAALDRISTAEEARAFVESVVRL